MIIELIKQSWICLKNNKSRNSTHISRIGAIRESNFLISNAKKAFNHLWLAFIKALILWYFDLESYIRIEIDVSSYAIDKVLSQLNLNSYTLLNQWHLIAYFSKKMISAETQYVTYNAELLAIIKAFKTWRHYLKGCKHKVLVLTNYNNLHRFMDIKSLSFCQVKWAQKLLKYYFQIDYCQSKANRAVDDLSRFFQKSLDRKKKL